MPCYSSASQVCMHVESLLISSLHHREECVVGVLCANRAYASFSSAVH